MMTIGSLIRNVVGDDLPVAIRAWDGTVVGPADAPAAIVIRSRDALRRILFSPGELGFARAYVAGDIEVEGDILEALTLRTRLPDVKLAPRHMLAAARLLGMRRLRPLPPPPEEVRLRGRTHSRARDAEAISHHYDVSNAFYERLLGPSMVYTCALFDRPDATLEDAQEAKLDLVCRKLALQPGMRVLDVGCGWGSLALHMAGRYGARVVAVTIAQQQVEYAKKRVADAGLGHLIEVRLQDYRDVSDGPYDAVAAVGILEHVGTDLPAYPRQIARLIKPGGRFLHHAIALASGTAPKARRRQFLTRYVFPDGELHEVGTVISAIQSAGFEARHMENLRDHYGLTLRGWLRNLEAHWDAAVAEIGLARARIWRLYMAGGVLNMEANRLQVCQVLSLA